MDPVYAKIFGNETVTGLEEDSPVSVQLGDYRVNISTAGGSVTIQVSESVTEDDTLKPE